VAFQPQTKPIYNSQHKNISFPRKNLVHLPSKKIKKITKKNQKSQNYEKIT